MSSAIHITPEGALKLQKELDELWKVERPRVVKAVSEATAMGDRSENAEYIYGKKKLREIDRRVRWLKNRLSIVTIVENKPEDRDKIFFGAYVRVKTDGGEELTYRMVGADDLDPELGLITLASPVGSALKGKKVGDVVKVQRPKGLLTLTVVDISYV